MMQEIEYVFPDDDEGRLIEPTLSEIRKNDLIEAVMTIGDIYAAAADIGITRSTLTKAKEEDPSLEDDLEIAVGRYKATILRRLQSLALNGWEKAVLGGRNKDQVVATDTIPSDKAMELLAKMHFADEMALVTRQRIQKQEIPAGSAAKVNFDQLTRTERRQLEVLMRKAVEGPPKKLKAEEDDE